MGIHEAPFLENSKHALLSTAQAQEAGTFIEEKALRYGGNQRMILQAEDTHELIEQPFGISDGLLFVDMSKPTKEDLEDLPRVWVTSGEEPWDPTIVD